MFPPYELIDQNPTLALSEIFPLSRRAGVALVRYQNGRSAKAGQMNIIGAIDMLDGLEYHHTAHMNIIQRLSHEPFMDGQTEILRKHLVHEATAYLNRMGQFFYFAHSKFAMEFLPDPDAIMPTLLRYKRFRDKHAAHRAIDAPRHEDTVQAQANYAWALSSLGFAGFSPKTAKASPPFDSHTWLQNYFQVQLNDGQPANVLNFSVEREHPSISAEVYAILENILLAV
jgi:hypothetical protein